MSLSPGARNGQANRFCEIVKPVVSSRIFCGNKQNACRSMTLRQSRQLLSTAPFLAGQLHRLLQNLQACKVVKMLSATRKMDTAGCHDSYCSSATKTV
jgi:hypothetical protein